MKIRSIFGSGAKRFFARRAQDRRLTQAKRYLRTLPESDDLLHLLRSRAQSAEDLMSDPVVNETIQLMNEEVVAEIAAGGLVSREERDMLYLKLQLISDFQTTLMQHISEYETVATIREAEMRQERDDNDEVAA